MNDFPVKTDSKIYYLSRQYLKLNMLASFVKNFVPEDSV